MGKVALVQMTSSAKVADNLMQVERFLHQAREEGAELAVLPENFASMALKETDKFQVAEIEGQGLIQQKISDLAKQLGIWVVAGTIPLKGTGTRVRASCMVYDNQGKQVARYDKIHLFDVTVSEHESHHESATIEPGSKLAVVDTPVGKIGLTVCYDLRFPELFYQLSLQGAQIFTVPSAFTAVTGLAHWEILLRTRAVDNLCYVLAPDQGGVHENGRTTYGHTMAVEPWGKVLVQKEGGAGVVFADIDLHRLQHLREQFPSINHHVLV